MNINIFLITIHWWCILIYFLSAIIFFFKNPVYSLLSFIILVLILTLIFCLPIAEFITLVLIKIYVGGILILFFFILIFLQIEEPKFFSQIQTQHKFKYFFLFIFFIKVFSLSFTDRIISNYFIHAYSLHNFNTINYNNNLYLTNDMYSLGLLFYTNYCHFFLCIGLLLLLSMLAAITILLNIKK
jgi:NADH:ubiquinone oxidoreductase subunit 6 (subunit J)